MAVYAQPGTARGASTVSIRRTLRAGVVALAVAVTSPAGLAAAMPRITVHGDRLYAGTSPWRAWGVNRGVGEHAPVIAYFDNPTAKNLSVLRSELHTARAMGVNSMTIYLPAFYDAVYPQSLTQFCALQQVLLTS